MTSEDYRVAQAAWAALRDVQHPKMVAAFATHFRVLDRFFSVIDTPPGHPNDMPAEGNVAPPAEIPFAEPVLDQGEGNVAPPAETIPTSEVQHGTPRKTRRDRGHSS